MHKQERQKMQAKQTFSTNWLSKRWKTKTGVRLSEQHEMKWNEKKKMKEQKHSDHHY